MNNVTPFEDRAGRSRSRHEGESSSYLCDRLSRTRDVSQRQLPTNQDYAVSTREYQTDQSSLTSAPTAAGLSSNNNKNHPTDSQPLTGSLHIRITRSLVECQGERAFRTGTSQFHRIPSFECPPRKVAFWLQSNHETTAAIERWSRVESP